MTEQEPSGVDLARVALARAKAAAKTAPPTAPKTRRTTSSRRGGPTGRDPMAFGAAIERLMNERGWEVAAEGGSIIDRWATIAPELVGKVSAERYDPETGTLHLRPHVDAYGTHLRLREREVVYRINAAAGGSPVRALRILPTGAAGRAPEPETTPTRAPAAPAAPVPVEPEEHEEREERMARRALRAEEARAAHREAVAGPRPEAPPTRTRENASDGFKRVRAVYLATRKRPT
jgi:predicted nucleic acid-binding Zn ribbon protein